ncbi:hypothetical protein [Mesorhizobium sp.]|uniref:hypothetical protein n=1 Tax=Mesorhizobium sp. TaxID=1871066 RepID=UPI000FE6B201|nr:hypothetical protein [Mesorhizobium sp.]RWL18067.1 MAG: hypothetical protein EOR57_22125 [Mesorhizobium sp.]TIP70759.1 MAG: hypothetical protein E5X55_26060 [Mesorhizobium sp.]TIQ16741.1 MAG: hypothetical protein E5X51_33725 [Mesorhizobium sp.]TJV95457.1 MAG: hypothetical protein E5X52_24105 [Mesorhizobium sp.]
MARRRRRKGESHTGTVIATVLVFAMSGILITGYAYLKVRAADNVVLDKTTLCPVDGPVSATAVLLDTTDPISRTTFLDLENEFEKQMSAVQVGGLLEIYGLTEEPGELIAIFSGCNPGDGSTVDELTSNPRIAQERWEEGYRKPLDGILVDINPDAPARRSPIMAAVQKIKLTLFDSARARDIPKRLVIASDMIEHTNLYSQYRSGVGYESYKESDARQAFRTSLDDVMVTFLNFQRQGAKFDAREHGEFWAEWVADHSGQYERWIRLEGVN